MIGQAQVIVGGKVEQRATVNFDARGLGRFHAAQFAEQSFGAESVEAQAQFAIKGVHVAGAIAHLPSIMLAATSPLWWRMAS